MSDTDGVLHECKACGRFRKERITPVAGDYVEFTRQRGREYGFIGQILPRKNGLARPAAANIDLLLVVVSARKPHADHMLCDKLLIQARRAGIPPLLCVNKAESGRKEARLLEEQYAAFDCLRVSAKSGEGIERLKELIAGKCVCFAGQSAVGKSSLINAVDPARGLEVGEMSRKTARGRHTTRTTELMYLPGPDAYVFDTPGFSMLDLKELKPEELPGCYPEFTAYAGDCRFTGCMHDKEPDCAVKRALEEKKIPAERYGRYLRIRADIQKEQGEEYG